jgi:SAM-dependent methyltransferase
VPADALAQGTRYTLVPELPWTPGASAPEGGGSGGLVAVTIEDRYEFRDVEGRVVHTYPLSREPEWDNCGGYVGKVIAYRDPALAAHLTGAGVSRESFAAGPFPLLATRSPLLDLLVLEVVLALRAWNPDDPVRFFDHGCTVAEHWDLLDVMLRARTGGAESSASALDYTGLDRSAQLLTYARVLHRHAPQHRFALIQQEGSAFAFPSGAFDVGLSVGVVNHTADPPEAMRRLLDVCAHALVTAVWCSPREEGMWVVNHVGTTNYLFTIEDLRGMAAEAGGAFYVDDYVPETATSQPNSYLELTPEEIGRMGSYHLLFARDPRLADGRPELGR